MRIKTFQAPTMQEALTMARTELGDEAVVLNTRQVKPNGLLGKYKPTKIELLAAADVPEGPAPAVDAPAVAPLAARVYASSEAAVLREAVHPEADPGTAMLREAVRPEAPVREPEPDVRSLRRELDELRSIVRGLLTLKPDPAPSDVPMLVRLGVDEDIARGELADILSVFDIERLTCALTSKLQAFAQPFDLSERRVIALVGPTGVGKTTTLAKLAAKFSLEQGKKVALVSADTFRIGAVEQLKTYARIMGIPLEVALKPDEVCAGIEKHKDADVILIDTVGRSQRSTVHLQELKAFVDAAEQVEVHLVTSATLSSDIQREVIEQFAVFSPRKLIITKLDEAPTRGCLVSLPLRTGLGISCTTAGQNVPQDIDFAEAGLMARFVTEVAE